MLQKQNPIDDRVIWGQERVAPWLPSGMSVSGTATIEGVVVTSDPAPATIVLDMLRRAHGANDPTSFGSLGLDRVFGNGTIYYVFFDWNNGAPTVSLTRNKVGEVDITMASGTPTQARAGWDDVPHHWRLRADRHGVDVEVKVYLDGNEIMSGRHAHATLTSPIVTLSTFAVEKVVYGHVAVWGANAPTATAVYSEAQNR